MAIDLQYSPLDSRRFGRRVFRATLERVDAAAIADAMRAERVDTLVFRLPAERVGEVAQLCKAGLCPIVADTQVHYDAALEDCMPANGRAQVELVAVAPHRAQELRALAEQVFDGYASHYAANPAFGKADVAQGYAEWAASHVGGCDTPVWFVRAQESVVGFTACRIDERARAARGVLNGILPRHRGNGYYDAMLRAMFADFRARGLQVFEITTQGHNVAVQRTWAALGLKLRKVEATVHVNGEFDRTSP